jgi:DNA (cytosine-5)-methyltransferase 1
MTRPAYVLPTLAEIAAVQPNGHVAASLFAGMGGSSTGYRIAGYRIGYACEFTTAAADTYAANMAPGTVLDRRDVRQVTGADILAATGPDLALLDGSPPCDPFSTSGKGDAAWGKTRDYLGEHKQRTDDLYPEFARLVAETRPRVFVAENVTGLIKGRARGYFLALLPKLRDPGYRVAAKVLDASWLGVPQMRQRVIIVGVRNDLRHDPVFPAPLGYRRVLREALDAAVPDPDDPEPAPLSPQLAAEWHRMRRAGIYNSSKFLNLKRGNLNAPGYTITGLAGTRAGPCHPSEPRRFTIAELRQIGSVPVDYVLTGDYAQQCQRIGQSVPPLMAAAIGRALLPVLSR